MENQIGIIINANAKKIRKMKTDPGNIYRKIGGELIDVRLTNSLSELNSVLKDFKKNNIKYIGIAGGDGSLHHALTHALHEFGPEKLPPLIILKGGTMDNVSRSLFLKGKGPAILKRVIKALLENREIIIENRSTMQIDDKYCFLFGTGFVTNFLEEAYSGTEKGLLQNIKIIGKSMKQIIMDPENGPLFRGLSGQIQADSVLLDLKEVKAILAGTVEHIGMGFSPLYRALEKPADFHAIITGIGPRTFLRNLLKLKSGIPLKIENHYDQTLREMKIQATEEFTYTMDGDLYTSPGKLLVTAGPVVRLVSV